MNEFEHTLSKIFAKRGMSLSDLAERAGYNPLFFRSIVSGKNRQVPVNFFVRIAEVLILSNEAKDELARSWAFGVERWY